jgi:hypothetical protein
MRASIGWQIVVTTDQLQCVSAQALHPNLQNTEHDTQKKRTRNVQCTYMQGPSCESSCPSWDEHTNGSWMCFKAINRRGNWPSASVTTQCLSYNFYCSCKQLTIICISSLTVSVLVRHSEICFAFSFRVLNWEPEIHTWTTGFSAWCLYENTSYKLHKWRFHHRYPGFRVPASSTILKLVRKAHSTGSFLGK